MKGNDRAVKEALRNLTRDMWNVPNMLTMARLIMVPVFAVLYLNGYPLWALAVFCLASLTDFLDGYLARKMNAITGFGKLCDPLADKLMVICALYCHVRMGVFPVWAVCAVAGKELLMVIGGAYMLARGVVVYANMWGKSATVCFIAALILGFFHQPLANAGWPVDTWLLYAAVILAAAAMMVYVNQGVEQVMTLPQKTEGKEGKEEKGADPVGDGNHAAPEA